MGNRAVIEMRGQETGIYLHWNGGRHFVEPVLEVAREYGISGRGWDYGAARLSQIFANFFGGVLSVGVGPVRNMDRDNGDNGVYILDEELNIIDRLYTRGPEHQVYDPETVKREVKLINDPVFLNDPLEWFHAANNAISNDKVRSHA